MSNGSRVYAQSIYWYVILLISIACVEETLASSYNTFADIHTI